MNKISLLQRQQAFQRDAINNEHKLVKVCKDQIKWLKGVPAIASTKSRIDGLYKCVEASRKKIAKLAEMQKFTKGQLQEAYQHSQNCRFITEHIEGMKRIAVWENYFYVPEPLPPVGDHTSYMKPGGERLPRGTLTGFDAGNYGGMTDHKCYDGPGGLRNDYKHNPKFMAEAPAAEVGSVVGDEL